MIGQKRERDEKDRDLNITDLSKSEIINSNISLFLNNIRNNSKTTCSICKVDITLNFIIISEKKDKFFCLHCLMEKSDNFLHECGQDFKFFITPKINFSLLTQTWNVQEEMLLLNGVEKFGLDNWQDISEYIESKNPNECQAHYYTFFYQSSSEFIPNNSDLIYIDNRTYDHLKSSYNLNMERSLMEKISRNPGVEQKKPNKDNIIDEETIARNISRGEFESEYINNAELKIADLEFFEDDTEDERNIKYELLQQYNFLIDEREKRKK